MNNIFKKIIKFKLKWLAKIYLWRIKPYVFIVAGTTNRHWIKEAIAETLKGKGLNVRVSQKNFNAEIGLPLSILDLPSGGGSFSGWMNIIWQSIKKVSIKENLIFSENLTKAQPDKILRSKILVDGVSGLRKNKIFLVLEVAISKPEDMDYLLSIVKPNAVALTTITMIYRENFEDLDEIANEYKKLVKSLPKNGILLLNFDDRRIVKLADFSLCKILTYGLGAGADYYAQNIKKTSSGLKFDICVNVADTSQSVSLFGGKNKNAQCESLSIERFGKHHIYAKIISYAIRSQKF